MSWHQRQRFELSERARQRRIHELLSSEWGESVRREARAQLETVGADPDAEAHRIELMNIINGKGKD